MDGPMVTTVETSQMIWEKNEIELFMSGNFFSFWNSYGQFRAASVLPSLPLSLSRLFPPFLFSIPAFG